MEKICALSGDTFSISEFEQEYCERERIPLPDISPFQRLKLQLSFRNRRHLHHIACAASGKRILSGVPESSGLKVFDNDIWESDEWDAGDYARDYDFSRGFFEQLVELQREVPHPNLNVIKSLCENSAFVNGIAGAKNCYLLFSASYNEDCMYSKSINRCRDLLDCICAYDCEICYECEDISNCYNIKYSKHCSNCSDSAFLLNCQGCRNCYGCVNLSQQEYCFFNEKLRPDDYSERIAEIDLGSYRRVEEEQERFDEFSKHFPTRAYYGKQNESSSGNYISNCKNAKNCYLATNAEDVEHSIYIMNAKNSLFHVMFGNNSELIYSCTTVGENVFNVKFCVESWMGVHDLEYCMYTCNGANNCFGCIGIQRRSYCILNKQYKKRDYEELVTRIKAQMRANGEYGKFFPPMLTVYPYNQSEAIDYFPAEKAETIEFGYQWADETRTESNERKTIPDNIREISDKFLDTVLLCEESGKEFKINRQELEFYRRQQIPVPRIAPLRRIENKSTFYRMQPLTSQQCPRCHRQFHTVYGNSLRTVICEKCFQEEVC